MLRFGLCWGGVGCGTIECVWMCGFSSFMYQSVSVIVMCVMDELVSDLVIA